ncbi:hypothetical protein [Pedobacter punctiformis]|uniref:Transposase n=1 Tax=Pedobacter punctiformis TaxID=3004097 RepID=A0ABT4LAH2_9SPHI|nr:hypothetical protein [Pedobacter sp. HCMS5-2]MCZ4244158.1 hypothetical protein [Pedobacter sp. HCMS5-2]
MKPEKITAKTIIKAIEDYYSGKQIIEICKDYEIEQEVFAIWLEEYKCVALELIELKIENERLRKLVIDTILESQSPNERLMAIKRLRKMND